MIRIAEYFQIPYKTSGDKHCTEGWIQFQCPYCNDGKYHLGWNIQGNIFNCWACGSHKTYETLTLLTNKPYQVIKPVLKQFTKKGSFKPSVRAEEHEISTLKYPWATCELLRTHKNYLRQRRYDPEYVTKKYQLKGTVTRIVIPVFWFNTRVSYIARSILPEESFKYIKCSKEKETYPSSSTLYGFQFLKYRRVVVVEGVFDAWRLGDGAVATLGTGYSNKQVQLLTEMEKVFIIFDNDRAGKTKAQKLASRIATFTDVEIVEINAPDPDSLSNKEAKQIMKELQV